MNIRLQKGALPCAIGMAVVTGLALLPGATFFGPLATVSTNVYVDSLAPEWQNWSWGTNLNFASSTAHAGKGIAVTHNDGWSGLYLHSDGIPLGGKQTLQFWINGGSSGKQTILIYTEDKSGRAPVQLPINNYVEGGGLAVNTWRKASIPLSALKLSAQYDLTGLTFQNGTDASQATYYLDEIALVGDGVVPTPTPYKPPPFGPAAPAYPTATPAGSPPAALPNQFGLGVASEPGGTTWMKATNAMWKYRYQYLCAGVNTSDGWKNWNSPSGEFATIYMNESAAGGYVPVFSYYQILQSNPRRYEDTLDAYAAKLNNAATMKSYFDDFKLLMQKCGAFKKPVIVHVEPDLWGYLQHTYPDPRQYSVKVALSGHAEATGPPNNAAGFAQMLVRLQGKYAPNVLLALHASTWAAGMDVSRNRDPKANIAAQADATGTFLNNLGSGWPLIFVDIADRDAAFKEIVNNDPGTWWDETDQFLPSFKQAHYWMQRLNQKTGRRLMIWQVPIGNTKMKSCNKSHGHYQDNRVQYYLNPTTGTAHIRQVMSCGVIGILFGRGDGNTTAQTDAESDGITNPAPIGSNTGDAAVSDDDGGYLRKQAKAYTDVPVFLK